MNFIHLLTRMFDEINAYLSLFFDEFNYKCKCLLIIHLFIINEIFKHLLMLIKINIFAGIILKKC